RRPSVRPGRPRCRTVRGRGEAPPASLLLLRRRRSSIDRLIESVVVVVVGLWIQGKRGPKAVIAPFLPCGQGGDGLGRAVHPVPRGDHAPTQGPGAVPRSPQGLHTSSTACSDLGQKALDLLDRSGQGGVHLLLGADLVAGVDHRGVVPPAELLT